MNTKRRTFLDHLNYRYKTNSGYSCSFRDYANLFLQWTQFQGYIPRQFTNSMYVFYNNKLSDSNFNNGQPDYENRFMEISDREEGLIDTIQEVGYKTEVYQLYCNLVEEHNFEKEFCISFVEAISPSTHFEKKTCIFKGAIQTEISPFFEAFLKRNMLRDKPKELELFLEDLTDFFNNFPKIVGEEFGYFLTKNINHYWEDVGLIIYSKSHLTNAILFYQIGDNN